MAVVQPGGKTVVGEKKGRQKRWIVSKLAGLVVLSVLLCGKWPWRTGKAAKGVLEMTLSSLKRALGAKAHERVLKGEGSKG